MKVCTRCGWTWDEFLRKFCLGCAECYREFREELAPYMAEWHGRLPGEGESDIGSASVQKAGVRLARLREELADAVRKERFGEAQRLKKLIQELVSNARGG